MVPLLKIDGSMGEGGGQVLRTSLTLSVLTGRPVEMVNIRAGRPKPGLRPQHLTAVRAAAAICRAEVQGDRLNSQRLSFRPQSPVDGGEYCFDVRDAAQGGSAGSVTLIVQTLLLPLAFAGQPSRVILRGGTHVPYSPPFHYLADVFLPAARRIGIQAEASLVTWGWYPAGGGECALTVQPIRHLSGVVWGERGDLIRVVGVAAVTNLPAHIPQRMATRAGNLLREAGIANQITALRERAPAAGAGLFLVAEYQNGRAGFSALGRQGKPAESVAEDACRYLLTHHDAGPKAAVDPCLADQLILPLSLAVGDSTVTSSEVTQHTLTSSQVVEEFLGRRIQVEQREEGGIIMIRGVGHRV